MSQTVTTKAMAKAAAVAASLAMVASALTFASTANAAGLTSSQVSAIVSLLQSFGADSATIANVTAALNGQATTGTSGSTSTSSSCSFTMDLHTGSSGAQVTCLQNALIAGGYSIPAGATGYFGAQTVAAVTAWQKAVGVSPASGYFGAISRAHWNLGGSSSTGSTGGTVSVGSGNGLKVSLSATSPNGTVLVQGQGIGDLADYVFANPTNSAITVTGLTFNRIGVSNDSTINNVYLYNGVNRITDSAGVSSGQFSFTNAGGIFTVQPGQTYTVSVRADIAGSTSGQQLGTSLVSVASSGTLDSSDSFPINSGYQTISAATLATVAFNATTLPSGAVTISPQTGYTLWQNTVSISQNPVKLSSMKFTNLGSVSSSNVQNLMLYVDGTQVGSTVASIGSDRTVTFNLSANPLLLNTGSHVIRVQGDITGGSSFTVQLSLQRSSDAMFIDSQLNQPVTPTSNNSTTNFSAVNASTITIQSVNGGGVSVSKDPASASNNVSVGATSVNWATFDMLAAGENTKVQDLYVCATVTGSKGAGEGLQNGKIYLNGVQVGSTKALVECSGANPSTTYTDFSLGSSLILPAGQNAQVSVYADAQTSTTTVANGGTVAITLVPGSSNAQGQSSLTSTNVPAAQTSGTTITLSSSSLTATKYSGYANQTIVPGSTNVLLGEFTLAAGSTEGVNVNTIGINASSTWAGYLTNLKLVNMSTGAQLGTTIPTPSSGTNTFSVGNVSIPLSGSISVGVYGTILSTATGGPYQLGVSSAATAATGASTGTTASLSGDAMLQSITPGSGTLTVSLGASNPVAANVIAGASSVAVADFNFAAANSSYTIQKLQVDASTTVASAITSVTLKNSSGTVLATLAGPTGTDANSDTNWAFSGLSLNVPAGGSTDVLVYVGTPTIASGGTGNSGAKVAVALNHNTNFQSQDSSGAIATSFSGSDIEGNANTGYGTLVVRQSIPTFSMLTNPNTTPSSGQSLYQFKVSADPAGAIDLDQVSFSVATSGAATLNLNTFKLYDITSGTAVQVGSTVGTGGLAGTALTFSFGSTTQQIGAGSSKTYELVAQNVNGWVTAGTSIQISLAQDTAYTANSNAVAVANVPSNIVWSDRSATGHTANTSDYTNGYLLQNFVNDVTSYTHN